MTSSTACWADPIAAAQEFHRTSRDFVLEQLPYRQLQAAVQQDPLRSLGQGEHRADLFAAHPLDVAERRPPHAGESVLRASPGTRSASFCPPPSGAPPPPSGAQAGRPSRRRRRTGSDEGEELGGRATGTLRCSLLPVLRARFTRMRNSQVFSDVAALEVLQAAQRRQPGVLDQHFISSERQRHERGGQPQHRLVVALDQADERPLVARTQPVQKTPSGSITDRIGRHGRGPRPGFAAGPHRDSQEATIPSPAGRSRPAR